MIEIRVDCDNEPVITDKDEPIILGDDKRVIVDNNNGTIIRSKNKVIIPVQNKPVLVEKAGNGTIVMVNREKQYAFLKHNDKNQYTDVFAREASIVSPSHQRKFFISDKCKFDVIRTSKGLEVVNIQVTERNIKSISQLPKIQKKKKENIQQQTEISVNGFKSTITELFREALRKNK